MIENMLSGVGISFKPKPPAPPKPEHEPTPKPRGPHAAVKQQAEDRARMGTLGNQRLGGYTMPLHENGIGTAPLNQAGKTPTTKLKQAEPAKAEEEESFAGKASEAVESHSKLGMTGKGFKLAKAAGISPGDLVEGAKKLATGNLSEKIEAGKELFEQGTVAKEAFETGKSIYQTGKSAFQEGVQNGDKLGKTLKNTVLNTAKSLGKEELKLLKEDGGDLKKLASGWQAKGAEISEYVGQNSTKRLMKNMIVDEGAEALTKSAVKTAAKDIGQAVAKAELKTAAKTAAAIGGKAAARFAPGVNVAMAAVDAKHAYDVWRDPKSTGWQKGCASVTAVGSALAATNIPVVSQIGAAVSIASSVLEVVKPEKVGKAVKNFFGSIFG
ncbi:hypothetical protein J7643_02900 [bacterium]|nr:hypothetical protein [bacterium]